MNMNCELPDICCTSSNAVEVVASIPRDTEILFCPDQFLGAHVQRMTKRDNIHIWMGECHVHAGINGADLKAMVAAEPDAELFVHPECGCATSAMYLASEGVVPAERTKILSTGGMLDAAREAAAFCAGWTREDFERAEPLLRHLGNRLYHLVIVIAALGVIATGLTMMVRVRTPLFARNPYMLGDSTWGLVYVTHGMAGVALVGLVIAHVYFALRPEKWWITKAMLLGWITRRQYLEHHDPGRWVVPSGASSRTQGPQ